MKIEHVALQVAHPADTADWYCRHLGFIVKRGADAPVPVRFLADASGSVMLELYNNSAAPMPDYTAMDPLLLHIAFVCEDMAATHARLIAAGATAVSGPATAENGDELAMLRDPWGLAIQLAKRAVPML